MERVDLVNTFSRLIRYRVGGPEFGVQSVDPCFENSGIRVGIHYLSGPCHSKR